MPSSSLTWNNKSTGAQNTKSPGARRSLWRFFQFRIGPWRVGPTILDRYILNEIAQPFLIFLLFFTVLFVSIALKDVIGDLLSKGIDPLKIGEFLSYLVLENLTVTLPVACLFAGILAAGRLSGDSEITALRAAGVSFPRIYIIFVFAGILSGACVLVMNFWVGPINAKAREDFQDWLNTYHSLSLVRPGRFLGRPNFDGLSTSGQDIYAERREGNVLKNVQIRKWHSELDLINSEKVEIQGQQIGIGAGFITQIIHADSGELLSRYTGEGEPEKFIRFSDGYLIELDEKQSGYQVTNFENGYLDYVIPPPPKPLGRLNVNATNFTFFELIDYINKLRDGGFEINPLTILGEMGTGVSDYQTLTGIGQDSPLAQSMPTIVMPSLDEIRRQALVLQMVAMNPDAEVPPDIQMPPGIPPAQFAIMLQTLIEHTEKTILLFQFEMHQRMATPVVCMLFFFISFPLGLVVKRSGKGMSFALALGIFVAYSIIVNLFTQMAQGGSMKPAQAAWIPVVLLFLTGVIVMSRRTDGFNPLFFITVPLRRLLVWTTRPLHPYFRPGSRFWSLYQAGLNSRPVVFAATMKQKASDRIRALLDRRSGQTDLNDS